MRFLLDENLSPHLARALRDLGEPVDHLRDVFGAGTPDREWIVRAAEAGYTVLSGDLRIRRTAAERDALRRASLGIFFVAPTIASHCAITQCLVKHWPTIKRLARTGRPQPFLVGQRSVRPLRTRDLR